MSVSHSGADQSSCRQIKRGIPMGCAGAGQENGALERIRTSDLCLRRAALYPAELWVPMRFYSLIAEQSQSEIVEN
jgi:hypothetical protein